VTYECVTANSNPPATIQWVVDNRTMSASSGLQSQTISSPLGGWTTHSNLTVKVLPNDRTKLISCNVVNSELNDVKTESAILTVICELINFFTYYLVVEFINFLAFDTNVLNSFSFLYCFLRNCNLLLLFLFVGCIERVKTGLISIDPMA
jgi:hypothetical protein